MSEEYCPVCKYKNEPGVQNCILCGTPLGAGGGHPTPLETTNIIATPETAFPQAVPPIAQKHPIPSQGIALYSVQSDNPIALQEEKEFILGRMTESEIEKRFVDLGKFDGYNHGVSRHHCLIRRTEGGYEIIDLGSTNGTWLEKQRLVPNRPYPLENGSRITLGRLPLIVYYQKAPVKK
jgi:FHA domain